MQDMTSSGRQVILLSGTSFLRINHRVLGICCCFRRLKITLKKQTNEILDIFLYVGY